MSRSEFRFGDLRIEGGSAAGDATWFRVRPPGIGFDAGRGAAALAGVRDLFLTHGHLDHALGVPFFLSQLAIGGRGGARLFCPAAIAADLGRLVEAAAGLERVDFDSEIVPLAAGDRVEVGRDLAVEAFATDHVVPSLGYHLLRTKRRLAARFHGAEPREIAAARRRGEEVDEPRQELWLSYCGDTGPGVFELEERLFSSRVLLIECTYLSPALRAKARRYGHIHLEDLAERESSFANEVVVLHHLSRRHRPADLRRELQARLPRLAPRVHLFGETA